MATAKKTTAKAPAKAVAKAPAKRSGKPTAKPAKPAPRRTKAAAAPAKSPAKSAKAPAKGRAKAPAKPAKQSPKPVKQPAKATPRPATKPAKPATKSATKPATKSATKPATPAPKASITLPMSSAKSADTTHELPKPKFNKDGLGYTKDFDVAFVKQQYDALQAERVRLTGQALRLEAEAHSLVEEAEMGDVKFDDEGGEGDTMNVERERDLALSAQAREAIEEIDAALLRITAGTYGYSLVSGRLIPRERLEALPWSSVLVEEKVGGIGRR
jgi:RNA polymerase-binding transcription factor DksA